MVNREEILDCLENDEFGMDWNQDEGLAFRDTVKNLISEGTWIPCSERLPDKEGWYLITVFEKTFGAKEPETLVAIFKNGKFQAYESYVMNETTAWQPIPEPYKGDKL